MPVYNFKRIGPVPSAPDLVDIVLMRTQRKTPTVVHPGYKISRIRSFYMRKIKFTQQTISERLGNIIQDFPRLNDIHPFYADLCNTLYDRDHYKLALGQLNAAKGLVEQISRDMIRMVKYGDSLYRCKCLKRAALGRMCTVLKRQKASLAYLEEVRKHLSRLPALDPNTRTLLLCGLPNVGKSSFLNKVTRGNVEVQPYAFTTKSLFVGHCDYKYLRWQVIDTPGILDHPLEERNTIEMQSIIALAHLTCAVLYIMDISEHCGYTIEQQCRLFQGIKPLFANKQLIVVVNKVDQQPWETLEAEKREMIESVVKMGGGNCTLMPMSNITEHGVSQVKNAACEKLLEARVDARVASNKIDSVMNRLQVFQPQPRDNVQREAFIPESVKKQLEEDGGRPKPQKSRTGYAPTVDDPEADGDATMGDAAVKKTARDLMWENGGPGVWAPDYRAIYDLKEDEWKFDSIPEIIDGKNIADFVDPDIENRLAALELEEEQALKELEAANMENPEESDLESEEEAAVMAIRDRKKTIRLMKNTNKTNNRPMMPREFRGRAKDKHDPGARNKNEIEKRMEDLGVDASKMIERGRSLDREAARKRGRSRNRRDEDDATMEDAEPMDDDGQSKTKRKKARREREESRKRDPSVNKRTHNKPQTLEKKGLNEDTKATAKKMERKGRKGWAGGAGEGDNRKGVHLVKWMNTGKKRNGTHYCR
ncbi:Nucleolar GTP-binding protein 1 [Seminavis robusta]|uniref:Nucleolar GTP-binding protein 1 n=1 Tax=Seminavis robusta TaxID=568900 RepID=A0A9N8E8J4_9STRA|nr:Nucleolar GTP-binding protein 1 [Seminavis robusta]|eukprot:Sro789_g202710.1 Nucleolar GTP-binding protein 1 (708) ;mRNA; r:38699-40924